MKEIEQLQARIKELESEKESAYQKGKNDTCDIFIAFISGDDRARKTILEIGKKLRANHG